MGGPSQSQLNTQNQLTQEQIQLAQQQQGQSNQLFQTSFPGFQAAEQYYTSLASGDPQKMMAAVAPSVNAIATQTQAAKNQITETMPRGGAEELALAQADIGKSSQIGNLMSSAYTSAFPALANLAQGGIGLSVNEVANAIASFGGASQANLGAMNTEAQGKASTMGFFGSLAGAAGMAAA